MNYELAKQLKDAGFPQSKQWGEITDIDNKVVGFVDKYGNKIVPTLEELIDACGEEFGELVCLSNLGSNGSITEWWATQKEEGLQGQGETPTEAVARLWLELNKKE